MAIQTTFTPYIPSLGGEGTGSENSAFQSGYISNSGTNLGGTYSGSPSTSVKPNNYKLDQTNNKVNTAQGQKANASGGFNSTLDLSFLDAPTTSLEGVNRDSTLQGFDFSNMTSGITPENTTADKTEGNASWLQIGKDYSDKKDEDFLSKDMFKSDLDSVLKRDGYDVSGLTEDEKRSLYEYDKYNKAKESAENVNSVADIFKNNFKEAVGEDVYNAAAKVGKFGGKIKQKAEDAVGNAIVKTIDAIIPEKYQEAIVNATGDTIEKVWNALPSEVKSKAESFYNLLQAGDTVKGTKGGGKLGTGLAGGAVAGGKDTLEAAGRIKELLTAKGLNPAMKEFAKDAAKAGAKTAAKSVATGVGVASLAKGVLDVGSSMLLGLTPAGKAVSEYNALSKEFSNRYGTDENGNIKFGDIDAIKAKATAKSTADAINSRYKALEESGKVPGLAESKATEVSSKVEDKATPTDVIKTTIENPIKPVEETKVDVTESPTAEAKADATKPLTDDEKLQNYLNSQKQFAEANPDKVSKVDYTQEDVDAQKQYYKEHGYETPGRSKETGINPDDPDFWDKTETLLNDTEKRKNLTYEDVQYIQDAIVKNSVKSVNGVSTDLEKLLKEASEAGKRADEIKKSPEYKSLNQELFNISQRIYEVAGGIGDWQKENGFVDENGNTHDFSGMSRGEVESNIGDIEKKIGALSSDRDSQKYTSIQLTKTEVKALVAFSNSTEALQKSATALMGLTALDGAEDSTYTYNDNIPESSRLATPRVESFKDSPVAGYSGIRADISNKIAKFSNQDVAKTKYSWKDFMGAMVQGGAGIVATGLGAALIAAPDPTGISKIAGGVLIAAGLNKQHKAFTTVNKVNYDTTHTNREKMFGSEDDNKYQEIQRNVLNKTDPTYAASTNSTAHYTNAIEGFQSIISLVNAGVSGNAAEAVLAIENLKQLYGSKAPLDKVISDTWNMVNNATIGLGLNPNNTGLGDFTISSSSGGNNGVNPYSGTSTHFADDVGLKSDDGSLINSTVVASSAKSANQSRINSNLAADYNQGMEEETNEAVSDKYCKVFRVLLKHEPDYIKTALLSIRR